MASNFFSSLAPSILTSPLPPPPPPPPLPHGIQLQPLGRFPSLGPLRWRRRRRRGEAVVTNAGPPSSTSLLIAFVLPLSLIAGTVFASIRVADALDEKYLEEVHCHCPRPPSVINLTHFARPERFSFLTLVVSALLQLAMTKAVSEENEDEEGDATVGEIVTDGEGNIVLGEEEEEVAAAAAAAANAVPRVRNRPRRRS
ncbi:uncharacterized protein M6B38_149445 [Iris pallida]|uniref:Uncharacterized protein n=1 Tax=Iris pallida TaxID=29817 RepID=A0AAX6F7Z5_IRIPA|nr:uncharacterized protein M6B38_149445 [Iris pallida]